MAISLTTGSSNSGSNDWSDVYNNDNDLVTEFGYRDSTYKTIQTAGAMADASASSGTFFLVNSSTTGSLESGFAMSGGIHTSESGSDPYGFYFDDADYSVTSMTTKLRVRGQVLNNGTAWSTVTATFGLYPVTVSGAAGDLTLTLGTVVTGSTVAIANPSANTVNQGNSGDFAVPADGYYGLGVVLSAAITANAASLLSAHLQVRHV